MQLANVVWMFSCLLWEGLLSLTKSCESLTESMKQNTYFVTMMAM